MSFQRTEHRVPYQVQTRVTDGAWTKRFSRMTRDGGRAILADFDQVVGELSSEHLVRAVVTGLSGEYGSPIRVLAIRNGARETE